jgi:hypothetical protein
VPTAVSRRTGWRLAVSVLVNTAIVVLGLPITSVAMGPGVWPLEFWLTVAVGIACLYPHAVLHEFGHLTAGYALRLRPVRLGLGHGANDQARSIGSLRVHLNSGGGFHVQVHPDPVGRLLPLRMTVFTLAGLAANLATAGAAYLAAGSLSRLPRAVVLMVAASAAVMAVANLVPFPSRRAMPGRGRPVPLWSDGAQALQWLLRPKRMRAGLRVPRPRLMPAADRPAPAADRPAQLLARLNEPGTAADLVAVAARVPPVVRDPQTDPDLAADLGVHAIWRLVEALLPQLAEPGDRVHRPTSGVLGVLADSVVARRPYRVDTRAATALVRVLQSRYREARELVTEAFTDGQPPAVRARALAVCALVEVSDGGDPAIGLRLLDRAAADEPDLFLLPLLRRRLDTDQVGAG